MANPSISAPKAMANAVSTTAVASPSCSSAMTTPIAMTRRRSVPAEQPRARQARVDRREQRGTPDEVADQEAQCEHQQRDQGTGHEPEELLDQALERRELQRVDRRDDETDPDDPEDDLRDEELGARHVGDAQHLAGAGAQREAVEVQPHEQPMDDPAGDDGHDEASREDDGRRDEPRHEQHERRRKVVPGLGERIGNFLNHRDLTPRPTSC